MQPQQCGLEGKEQAEPQTLVRLCMSDRMRHLHSEYIAKPLHLLRHRLQDESPPAARDKV